MIAHVLLGEKKDLDDQQLLRLLDHIQQRVESAHRINPNFTNHLFRVQSFKIHQAESVGLNVKPES